MSNRRVINNSIVYILLFVALLITIIPIWWMISTSFKAPDKVFTTPIQWFPDALRFSNYVSALTARSFDIYFLNSLFAASASVVVTVLLSSAAGYSFSKFDYPGRDLLFVIVLSTLMIPFEIIALPLYLQVHSWGWLNTYAGLILPTSLFAIGIFIMRQFIMGVPNDLIDSARIDGASEPKILSMVIIPLSAPAMAAVSIFTFVFTWNSYLWPLLVITRDEMRTLPLGMALFENQLNVSYNKVMAVAVFGALPLVIMFILFQRHFIRGISMTGLREG